MYGIVWGIDKFNGEYIYRNYTNRKYYVYGIVGTDLFDCHFCGNLCISDICSF